MTSAWYARFEQKQRKFVISSTQVEENTPAGIIWKAGVCGGDMSRISAIAKALLSRGLKFESIAELYMTTPEQLPKPGRIARFWMEALGRVIIPFDPNERKQIAANLDGSFQSHLAEWLQFHEAQKSRSKT